MGLIHKDVKSIPVGYLDTIRMYPLDFEEFCLACNLNQSVLDYLNNCFDKKELVDSLIHKKMLLLFKLYLIIGGMPEVVQTYVQTNNLFDVKTAQQNIINLYLKDIAKYDTDNKLYIDDVYKAVASELNSENKRFILKNLNENARFNRYENALSWLKNSAVTIPVHLVDEPVLPLVLSKRINLLKLFLNDVGLLACMYSTEDVQIKILRDELDINFGAIFENAVAQELVAHGFDVFYYKSNKIGEIDFVVELGGQVIPIEVKSGGNYLKHLALDKLLQVQNYKINQAYVFNIGNTKVDKNVFYLPVYMIMFLKQKHMDRNLVYKLDLSDLQV